MTDERPDGVFEPLEETEEELVSQEEEAGGGLADEDQEPTHKNCLFCGAQIDRRSKACPTCGHALGPYEPTTPKEFYRFFFCGLLLFMGALLPCGVEGRLAINTMFGSLVAMLGMGVMWSMFKAIYTGRVKLLWVVLTIIPLAITGFRIATAFMGDPKVEGTGAYLMAANGVEGWGSLVEVFSDTPPRWGVLRSFFWVVGFSNIFFALGSLLAWILLVGGVFSGVKHSKQQAAARAAAPSRSRGRKR
jgi:hypothetical protein